MAGLVSQSAGVIANMAVMSRFVLGILNSPEWVRQLRSGGCGQVAAAELRLFFDAPMYEIPNQTSVRHRLQAMHACSVACLVFCQTGGLRTLFTSPCTKHAADDAYQTLHNIHREKFITANPSAMDSQQPIDHTAVHSWRCRQEPGKSLDQRALVGG